MGYTVSYHLSRDAVYAEHERERLASHVAAFRALADDQQVYCLRVAGDGLSAEGDLKLDPTDDESMSLLLAALTELRGLLDGTRLRVDDDLQLIRWSSEAQSYVLGEPQPSSRAQPCVARPPQSWADALPGYVPWAALDRLRAPFAGKSLAALVLELGGKKRRSTEQQLALAQSLVGCDDPGRFEYAETLMGLDQLSRGVVAGLRGTPGAQACALLTQLAEHADPEVALSAAAELVETHGLLLSALPPRSDLTAEERLLHRNPDVRRRAISELHQAGDPAMLHSLLLAEIFHVALCEAAAVDAQMSDHWSDWRKTLGLSFNPETTTLGITHDRILAADFPEGQVRIAKLEPAAGPGLAAMVDACGSLRFKLTKSQRKALAAG